MQNRSRRPPFLATETNNDPAKLTPLSSKDSKDKELEDGEVIEESDLEDGEVIEGSDLEDGEVENGSTSLCTPYIRNVRMIHVN